MHGRKLEQRPEQLVSNWLRVRKLPEEIHCYRNAELRSNDMALSSPSVPYGDGFLTCEEHPIAGAGKALLSYALSVVGRR
jgi:DNA recombination-dependent growth factor C